MKRETYPNRASNHTYIVCLVSFGTGIPQSTEAREIEKSLNPLLIQPWTYKLCLHETDWRTCIFLNNKNKHIQKARLICNKATQPPRLCCNWKPKYWMFRSKIWDLNICWFRYWLQFLICHCKFRNPLFAINVSTIHGLPCITDSGKQGIEWNCNGSKEIYPQYEELQTKITTSLW